MSISPHNRVWPRLLIACALMAGSAGSGATPAQAQTADDVWGGRAWVMQAGRWYTDVDGLVGSVRAELPVGNSGRWLLVPGVTYSHYSLRASPTQIDLFAPEAMFQRQLGRGRIRPYVGAGGGLVLVNMFHTVDPTLSLATGLRANLGAGWGARVELDSRAFGGFEAGAVGWSVGLARQF